MILYTDAPKSLYCRISPAAVRSLQRPISKITQRSSQHLKTYQPTIIWRSPSYAWQLGEKAKKAGIDPKKDLSIKKIIVAGELGGSIDATRKARIGVKPYKVIVHPDGGLDTRSEHKSKRIIDERKLNYTI